MLGMDAESRRVNITAKTPNPPAINYFANCATFSLALRLINQYDEFQGEKTMKTAFELGLRIGKQVVVLDDRDGNIVKRTGTVTRTDTSVVIVRLTGTNLRYPYRVSAVSLMGN